MNAAEAFEQIRAAGNCFVIFDADTGEVLEVRAAAGTPPFELVRSLGPAAVPHKSVMGRFFDGATITLDALAAVVDEAQQRASRVKLFSRWAAMPPEALVQVLETDEFAPPMDTVHGPRLVIERIFDYPPDALDPLVPRLERIVVERDLEPAVRRLLESRLAVLAGDFARLAAVWTRFDRNSFNGVVWHPELLECIGDLRPRDPEVIEILIRTASHPKLMFGTRAEAMRSLGKVGAPAGPRAAAGIRATISDSERWIIDLRERVLARIEGPEREDARAVTGARFPAEDGRKIAARRASALASCFVNDRSR
jgi:hypothetical protein